MNWYDICFFPFSWDYALGQARFEDNTKRFTNGFFTYFEHANTDHIVTIMFLISSTEKSTSESDFSVIKGKSDCNVLPLSINEHCFAKKELKILLFSLKSVIYYREKVVVYR